MRAELKRQGIHVVFGSAFIALALVFGVCSSLAIAVALLVFGVVLSLAIRSWES